MGGEGGEEGGRGREKDFFGGRTFPVVLVFFVALMDSVVLLSRGLGEQRGVLQSEIEGRVLVPCPLPSYDAKHRSWRTDEQDE